MAYSVTKGNQWKLSYIFSNFFYPICIKIMLYKSTTVETTLQTLLKAPTTEGSSEHCYILNIWKHAVLASQYGREVWEMQSTIWKIALEIQLLWFIHVLEVKGSQWVKMQNGKSKKTLVYLFVTHYTQLQFSSHPFILASELPADSPNTYCQCYTNAIFVEVENVCGISLKALGLRLTNFCSPSTLG